MKRFIVLLCCILCIALAGCDISKNQSDLKQYEAERNEYGYASEFMPELGSLGNYGNIEYRRKSTSMFIFAADAMTLFVDYGAENYNAQKQAIEESYTFAEEPVTDDQGNYIIPVTEFELYGYNFRLTPVGSAYSACKSFGLIGLNDEETKLCYAYFYDSDLDYICEADEEPLQEMLDFMQKYFEWI